MLQKINKWLIDLLSSYNISYVWHDLFITLIKLVIAFVISYIVFRITKKILVVIMKRVSRKTKTVWDDIMFKNHVFSRMAYIVPVYLLALMVPLILSSYPEWINFFIVVIKIYSAIIVTMVFVAFFNSVHEIYQQYPVSKIRPIKGYIQVVKIILYFVLSVVVISFLIGQNPLIMIGGLGAFSAVLLLVFKDSLLGLVAGIQLTANDALRQGDWIMLPKYDTDGTVIDITLTTVKVQNWDKTYSVIPAYALYSESFKNWRGMEESGGRRVKRSVNIDMSSIKFCTPKMLEKFSKIEYLSNYIAEKEAEISEYNKEKQINPITPVNGRRQTNIGVFRNYLIEYLKNHPKINQDMPLTVRQLQPTETGLPLEIYAFVYKKNMLEYEPILADIFDHILAVLPFFELRIFQNPMGYDFKTLTPKVKEE
ncbi:MAG: mechanosensitive ion channel domain-containing protein [Bacteroidales bacterium]|jgi:miniconductance mechanosensitive channel|nr:mechanosensitive ion channel [Bacteroidales bacterium]MDI9592256.1 mechanosensitive ion channel [Bacteroidota bacterium]NLH32774.1 mechanosensitive ion channel [Lentimicrobium sp.]OQC38498.1 MAG: Miniconductance mechanosensitive channel YbdG [Bacteroidetes bacterium ADurb.Bin041]MBP7875083.1 mechanosensitive ion channel [Bacteroidales bacterium]